MAASTEPLSPRHGGCTAPASGRRRAPPRRIARFPCRLQGERPVTGTVQDERGVRDDAEGLLMSLLTPAALDLHPLTDDARRR
jgi:hypothetical protein